MSLPKYIPIGVRLVIRTLEGRNQTTGRWQFRDYMGHVVSWDGKELVLKRDPSANGSRPAQVVSLQADSIVRLKPIPERSQPQKQPGDRQSPD